MIKQIILGIICAVILFSKSEGQSLTKKESQIIRLAIDTFTLQHDHTPGPKVQEFILIVLEVDSNGIISRVNIMADQRRVDKIYPILQQLEPKVFHNRVFSGCKNKLLLIPFVTYSANRPGDFYTRTALNAFRRMFEGENAIILPTIQYVLDEYHSD